MYVSDIGWEVFVLIQGGFQVCTEGNCKVLSVPGQYVVVFPGGNISNPAGWPGPMLDLTASVNFLATYITSIIDRGLDGLPRFRDLNDALKTRNFKAPAPPPPSCGDEC
jgi:hypothetical protein